MKYPIVEEWWRDPRCHFGSLTEDDTLLLQRVDLHPAIEFICAELGSSARARILDLCCGPGRYAIELALKGFAVVGIDLNEQYLAIGRHIADREDVALEFLSCDMREIPFIDHFDAVINVGTSFGFFDEEKENKRVVEAVVRALKPDGLFLLEMANRDYLLRNFIARDWKKLENGNVLLIQRGFDYMRSRIDTRFEIKAEHGDEHWGHSWRAYTLAEIVSILEEAGLVIHQVYGGWDRSEYSTGISRMVIISKKSS